ncbi:hypothetical protein ElyMa_003982900 [Elysia marginata]|uniref:Uncharacterized protein n=1 Tax=Elysia marginata TaxID=1093978 RepID=A0AAV4FXH8_9GAST|nr:hypothetical protein ElyMa_003982900 [Elysia marginata]
MLVSVDPLGMEQRARTPGQCLHTNCLTKPSGARAALRSTAMGQGDRRTFVDLPSRAADLTGQGPQAVVPPRTRPRISNGIRHLLD